MNISLKHKIVKIRKPHRCYACSELFESGEEMMYLVSVFNGDFGTSYWCKPCDAYATKYWDDFMWDGVGEGEFKNEPQYLKFKQEYDSKRNNV